MLGLLLASLAQVPGAAERVLVLVNRNSPTSRAIAEDYCRKRALRDPLEVECPDSALGAAQETIAYPLFARTIELPLRAALAVRTEVDFIVLTKGIPLRIEGAPGFGVDRRRLALDSWIAAFGYEGLPDARRIELRDKGFSGTAYANRFWNSSRAFSHKEFGGYLVTRLDGYAAADALALVARALEAEARPVRAPFLLDVCPAYGLADAERQPIPLPATHAVEELPFSDFNADLAMAARLLEARGQLARLESSDEFAGGATELAGYASWGSNDKQYSAPRYRELRFAPGAIAETAVSTSARTFLPTQGGQSLVADLLQQGATGAKGYCDEPLLQAISSPSILFDRYARGWTLAESYYAAARFVAWEDIVLGDPLCRPYAR